MPAISALHFRLSALGFPIATPILPERRAGAAAEVLNLEKRRKKEVPRSHSPRNADRKGRRDFGATRENDETTEHTEDTEGRGEVGPIHSVSSVCSVVCSPFITAERGDVARGNPRFKFPIAQQRSDLHNLLASDSTGERSGVRVIFTPIDVLPPHPQPLPPRRGKGAHYCAVAQFREVSRPMPQGHERPRIAFSFV